MGDPNQSFPFAPPVVQEQDPLAQGAVARPVGGVPLSTPPTPGAGAPQSRQQLYEDAVRALVAGNATSEQSALIQAEKDSRNQALRGTQAVTQTRGGQTSVTGVEQTPETRAHAAKAYEAQNTVAAGYEMQGRQAAEQSVDVAKQAEAKAAELDQMAAKNQAATQDHQIAMQGLQEQADTASAEYQKQAKSMDPERILAGGKRVAAAFAMALGAAGAVLGKSQNFAMQIINDRLDRDWAAQKEQLGAAKDKQTLSQQSIQNSRQLFADDQTARLNYKADMLQAWGAHAESMEARHKGANAEVQGEMMSDRVKAEAEDARVKRDQLMAQTKSSTSTSSTSVQAAPATKVTDFDLIKESKERAEAQSATDKAYGHGPDDQDKAYANKVRAQIGGLSTLVLEGKKMNESRGKESWFNPLDLAGVSADARETNMREARVRQAKVLAQTGKAANKDELERVDEGMYGGARTNAGKIDTFGKSSALDAMQVHEALNGMHEQLRAETIERMRRAYPKAFVDSVVNGTEYKDNAGSAGDLGATVRNKKK